MTRSESRWQRLGVILHRLSYLKVLFYLLGFYYLFMEYFGSQKHFLHNVCSSLFMFGLAMLMEALRDNELAAKRKYAKKKANLETHQVIVTCAIVMFSFVVLQGLFFLYYLGEKFVGEAILTFGIGGLAFLRLEYDCLSFALSARENREVQKSPPAADRPEILPETAGGQPSEVVSGERTDIP
jgi:hypothetical protein